MRGPPPLRQQVAAEIRRPGEDEVGNALAAVRRAYPETARIRARPDHAWGVLVLTVDRDLAEAVAALVEASGGLPELLRTGFEAFDRAAAELGAEAVALVDADLGYLSLYFGRLFNAPAAAARWQGVGGVRHAAPDRVVGDGPDVEVERAQAGWVVRVVDAWDDCPSGCLHSEVRTFRVSGGRAVELVGED